MAKYIRKKDLEKMEWPYSGTETNKKYIKDRNELFAKHGNGWWLYVGVYGLDTNKYPKPKP